MHTSLKEYNVVTVHFYQAGAPAFYNLKQTKPAEIAK